MHDCISFIILICAIVACLVYSLNKVGYDFTLVDSLTLSLVGIGAFLIPYAVVRFAAHLILQGGF